MFALHSCSMCIRLALPAIWSFLLVNNPEIEDMVSLMFWKSFKLLKICPFLYFGRIKWNVCKSCFPIFSDRLSLVSVVRWGGVINCSVFVEEQENTLFSILLIYCRIFNTRFTITKLMVKWTSFEILRIIFLLFEGYFKGTKARIYIQGWMYST